jgi:GntR family transcriptional regulator
LGQRNASSGTASKAAARSGKAAPRRKPEGLTANVRGEPLYVQVVATLKAEILKGAYPVGTQLPSEDELAQRFSVSRHTIREALRRLRDDGLIASRRGAATTVVRPAAGGSYVHEIASINDLISFVSTLRFHVDSVEMVTTDAELAARLGSGQGEKWLRVDGFRFASEDDNPACWMEVFVHEDYAGVARLLDHNKGPIFELIETLYGERIVEVEQTLRTSPMPQQAAARLGTEPGETSVEVTRTFRTASGNAAEVSIAHYPADTFTFSMKLRRTR